MPQRDIRVPAEVSPTIDLKRMLPRYIIRRSTEVLERAARRRAEATKNGTWMALRDQIRERGRAYHGGMPFGKDGGALNDRIVSKHERPHYRLENVLFESLPGWEVNASVYLPVGQEPPYPAVVVPVGHSGKQFESYQIPAQVFARCGYAAVLFDPPGQASEKRPGNDHFHDGVRCYLTGHSSNRYFVIDALRCIDYLRTRDDVDTSNGVAMTGVSGGGVTTLWSTLFDERIACIAPSCCISPLVKHPVGDLYAGCPETHQFRRFADGLDQIDLVCAAMPVPTLAMAGQGDEVFHIEWTRGLCEEVAQAFASVGHADRFEFFEDAGGHEYSMAQALQFVRWMNRWLLGQPDRPVPEVTPEDCRMEPWEVVRCYPAPEENIFTINRQMARDLKDSRDSRPGRLEIGSAIRRALELPEEPPPVPSAITGEPFYTWLHYCQEVVLQPEEGIELPATFLYPIAEEDRSLTILYFDDRGRWEALRQSGPLARMAQFVNRDAPKLRAVFSVDLRGWGDTKPTPSPFDIAGWSGEGRPLAYISNAMGESLFAMRVRDALSALAYVRSREEVGPEEIVVAGHGMGAVVALHVAALAERLRGVIVEAPLACFQELTESERYTWPPDAFVPEVLKHYDLPELLAALAPTPALVVNPLDAVGQPVPDTAALFGHALSANRVLEVRTGLDGREAAQTQLEWLGGLEPT